MNVLYSKTNCASIVSMASIVMLPQRLEPKRNEYSAGQHQYCISYYIAYALCHGSRNIIGMLERESLFGSMNERLIGNSKWKHTSGPAFLHYKDFNTIFLMKAAFWFFIPCNTVGMFRRIKTFLMFITLGRNLKRRASIEGRPS